MTANRSGDPGSWEKYRGNVNLQRERYQSFRQTTASREAVPKKDGRGLEMTCELPDDRESRHE